VYSQCRRKSRRGRESVAVRLRARFAAAAHSLHRTRTVAALLQRERHRRDVSHTSEYIKIPRKKIRRTALID